MPTTKPPNEPGTHWVDKDLFHSHAKHLSGGAVALFAYLCYLQDDERTIPHLSHSELARRTGRTRPTIIKRLRELTDYGLVTILPGSKTRTTQSPRYQLVDADTIPAGGRKPQL